jgi:predicted aspartyl protease
MLASPRSGRGGISPTETTHQPRPSFSPSGDGTIALWRVVILAVLPLLTIVLPIRGNAVNPAAPDVAATNCSAKRLGEISISTLNGVPVVIPIANGVPVSLLLDTGAERTVLTPAAAQRVGAQQQRVEFDRRLRGIEKSLPMREMELQRFTIGGIPIAWRRVGVASASLPGWFAGPLDGVLGADVLSSFDVEIDLPRHRMILHERSSCGVAPDWPEPYVGIDTGRSAADRLFFPARLDDRRIVAIIDTGAARSTLSSRAAQGLGLTDGVLSRDRSVAIRGVAGELVAARIHRFSRLEVAELTIRHAELLVADLNLRDADLVLGSDFISSRRMWLSYGSRRIFLSTRKDEAIRRRTKIDTGPRAPRENAARFRPSKRPGLDPPINTDRRPMQMLIKFVDAGFSEGAALAGANAALPFESPRTPGKSS